MDNPIVTHLKLPGDVEREIVDLYAREHMGEGGGDIVQDPDDPNGGIVINSIGTSGSSSNLDKVHVFILDTANDEVVMQYGAADKYRHRIQT